MFTSLRRKIALGLVIVAVMAAGSRAVAGEPATIITVPRYNNAVSEPSMGSDGRSYHSYGDDGMGMLDAINRDHPVHTPY